MITRVTNDVNIAKLTGFLGEYCSKEGIRRCAVLVKVLSP